MICNCTDKWPVLMDDRAQVGVQLPTLADNVALLTFADELRAVATSLSTRRPPPINITELSSKPSTYHGCGHVMAQTDGQTPDHFIDPTPHTVSSVKNTYQHQQATAETTLNKTNSKNAQCQCNLHTDPSNNIQMLRTTDR